MTKKTIIIILRTCTLLLLLACILEPLIKFTLSKKPYLLVLIDTSKSIGVGERVSKIKQILPQIKHNKKIYGFDAKPYPLGRVRSLVGRAGSLDPANYNSISTNGNQTNFANALSHPSSLPSKLVIPHPSSNPSAYLILSDGINNSGPDPIQIARQKNIPIYTIKIGTSVRDIRISSIHFPKIAYTRDKIPITVNIENVGAGSTCDTGTILLVGADSHRLGGIPIRRDICDTGAQVFLKENNTILQKKKVLLPEPGTQKEVSFKISHKVSGTHLYEISISHLPGELTYDNNKRDFGITILKSRIKAGWFGTPSWNFKFAALELSKDEKIKFHPHLKLHPAPYTLHPASEYDVLILENPEYKASAGFSLREVSKGKGIIIIGKGYENISPFLALGSKYLPKTPFPVIKHQDVFGATELPPIQIYQVKGLKSGADVLCATEDHKPVIAKMNLSPTGRSVPRAKLLTRPGVGASPRSHDQGTVIAIASDEIWKWNFNYQIKFWSNLIKLCAQPDAPKFWVEPEKPVYKVGERLKFNAQLYDNNYNPCSNSNIFIKIQHLAPRTLHPAPSVVPFYSLGNGNYEAFIDFLPPAEYKYIAECRDTIYRVQSDSVIGEFKVVADLEFQNLEPDENFLRALADASGGKYINNINELNNIKLKPRKAKLSLNLTHFWFSLILIIALLSAEWTFLRR